MEKTFKIVEVAKELTTEFECDCCGKMRKANSMVWLEAINNSDDRLAYGKTCFSKIKNSLKISK